MFPHEEWIYFSRGLTGAGILEKQNGGVDVGPICSHVNKYIVDQWPEPDSGSSTVNGQMSFWQLSCSSIQRRGSLAINAVIGSGQICPEGDGLSRITSSTRVSRSLLPIKRHPLKGYVHEGPKESGMGDRGLRINSYCGSCYSTAQPPPQITPGVSTRLVSST